jgi:hypothetical protein
MSTDDDSSNTGLVLALVGAGAALAWLLWRGRGTRETVGQSNARGSARPTVVRICSGDRVKIERVGRAGVAEVFVAGDARHSWVERVRDALQATRALIRWHDGTVVG